MLEGHASWHLQKVTWKEFDEDFISSNVIERDLQLEVQQVFSNTIILLYCL